MHSLQKSFAGGEVTPKYWIRNDIENLHEAGVKRMENVIADAHGPARSRKGSEFIQDLQSSNHCRLFNFNVSLANQYIVAMTPDFIYVLDRNGFIVTSSLVENGRFNLQDSGWTHDDTTFAPGVAILQPVNSDAYVRQQLTTTVADDLHRIVIAGDNSATISHIKIGTTEGGGEILDITNVGQDYELEFTPNALSFWVEILVEHILPLPPEQENQDIKVIDSIQVYRISDAGDIVTFPSPYDENDLRELQTERAPGGQEKYFVCRGKPPMVLQYIIEHEWLWEEVDFYFGSDEEDARPPLWGEEYPGAITFHDGRMCLAGTYLLPATVWLSRPSEYTNFDLGDAAEVIPSDAMILPLSKYGAIQWLASNTRLFVGMDTGEHIIFGNSGPLAPGDAQTEQQSTYGSARIQAIIIEEQVAYYGTGNKTLRLMRYADEYRVYKSRDLTFQADHIIEGGVKELHHGDTPSGMIYQLLFNGDLVLATFEDDQKTIGWHRHNTNNGVIVSMTLASEVGIDVVYLAVQRLGRIYIEKIHPFVGTYMDSHKEVYSETMTKIFSGFEHLANQTVQVVADNKMHPDVTVEADGSIELLYDAQTVQLGIQYNALIETLPEQFDDSAGNTLNHSKRYSELFVYLLDSPRPIVNGFDTFKRFSPTPMDTRQESETGIISGGNDVGWDKEATVIIEQPRPLDMNIAGVGGKLKQNKI